MTQADQILVRKRSRRRRMRWWIAGGVITIVAIAVALRLANGEGELEFRTAAVERGTIESTITALGKIQPKHYVDVGAQVSGQLRKIHVEVGDRVAQGDLLAEIDPTILQARVDGARAQLRELEANKAQQEAELTLARSRHVRSQRMLASDAISRDEAEAAESAVQVAEARVRALEAQIERLSSTLKADEANLDFTRIYAPIAGTVVSFSALEGQTLNANQTAPTILRIADLTVMTVSADVSEADVTRLSTGMPAYFNTLGNQERRWHTTVRQVLPQPEIVNDVVLYKALLDVDNEGQVLLPEMTAQIFFVLGRAEDVVVVPIAALVEPGRNGEGRRRGRRSRSGEREASTQDGAGAARAERRGRSGREERQEGNEDAEPGTPGLVRVVNGKAIERRRVRVGLKTRTEAEIISGLEPGEVVIVGRVTRRADGEEARSLLPSRRRGRRGRR
ncbi:MAG: efflux RND transporter periplasmic adaptor subunit [bacterium]